MGWAWALGPRLPAPALRFLGHMVHLGLREKVLAGEKELGEEVTSENWCFMVTPAQGVASFTNNIKKTGPGGAGMQP